MNKHTPGSWEARGNMVWAGRPLAIAPDAAYKPNIIEGAAEVEANIRIMAAAPDLLEALETLVADERKFVTCYREAADSYTAVCNFCGASHNDEYQIEHKPDCAIKRARAVARARGERSE